MSANKLTDETTRKVANLIKINIPDAEIPNYTKQLNTVLEAVEVLGELDTKQVVGTSQTHGLVNVLRDDEEVEPGLDMTKYKNNQNFKNGYFIVKKVL
jgi:aspartyl-tRNA(Asn)/glutamyl-tRNA(Gln) amidotransferase subunit C